MNNKKGMELSINTLVVVILGVVLLGAGIFFLQNIMSATTPIINAIDGDSETRIKNLLSDGRTIEVLENSRTGGYGEYFFAAGFINRIISETNFTVNITPNQLYVNDEAQEIPLSIPPPLFYKQNVVLSMNEEELLPFAINIPRGNPHGTYEYFFEVLYYDEDEWKQYGHRIVRVRIR